MSPCDGNLISNQTYQARVQVAPGHYFARSYDSSSRFVSYWHQIDLIWQHMPGTVLEVGVGNRFVASYRKERGVSVTTLDIDERLRPDVVGSVTDIPFGDRTFDMAACFEVLEHLPFDCFITALREMTRVAKSKIFLSLPDASWYIRCMFSIQSRSIKVGIPLPRLIKRRHVFDGEHYWEIGKKGYPLAKILRGFSHAGLVLEKTFRVFDCPYHRFFVLRRG